MLRLFRHLQDSYYPYLLTCRLVDIESRTQRFTFDFYIQVKLVSLCFHKIDLEVDLHRG